MTDVIRYHGLSHQMYADDVQLYGSFLPIETSILRLRLSSCVKGYCGVVRLAPVSTNWI